MGKEVQWGLRRLAQGYLFASDVKMCTGICQWVTKELETNLISAAAKKMEYVFCILEQSKENKMLTVTPDHRKCPVHGFSGGC